MLLRNHRKQTLKLRLIILSITSLIFLTSFVLNITFITTIIRLQPKRSPNPTIKSIIRLISIYDIHEYYFIGI
jgi:hypothetical protein